MLWRALIFVCRCLQRELEELCFGVVHPSVHFSVHPRSRFRDVRKNRVLYTPYILRGFYFHEFRESGAIRKFINRRKYLPPIPTHECDLCTQCIALLDRELNHSRKCLKFPIRKKLDSRNIWRIQYYIRCKCTWVFFFIPNEEWRGYIGIRNEW